MIVFTAASLVMSLLIPSATHPATSFLGSGDQSTPTAPSDSNLIPLVARLADIDSTEATRVFSEIESGIVAADAGNFSRHFGKQTYLSIKNSADAYYSSNQAQNILTVFFAGRRVISFRLSSLNSGDRFPYATGGGVIRRKGNSEMFQVYVSLSKVGGRLVIDRLNIY